MSDDGNARLDPSETEELASVARLAAACHKPHWLLTGRATTALYLLLESRAIRGRSIVLPVNVCYSLVHAVTLSGNTPHFVDVHPDDGNIRCEHLRDAWSVDPPLVVAVHNLGNPCPDLDRIAALCRQRGTLLVEDCAAAIGGWAAGQPLGTTGDCSLFSFGSGKTVDAELGGMLASNEPLDVASQLNQRLDPRSESQREKSELFTQLYRLVYHSSFHDQLAERMGSLREFFQDSYLFRLTPDQQRQVAQALRELPTIARQRREQAAWFDRELPCDPRLRRYPMAGTAVPWRYNVLVDDPRLKQALIDALLAAGVRVSRWYPPVHRLFGQGGEFPGAEQFAGRIVNWPLDTSPEAARRIVDLVRSVTHTR